MSRRRLARILWALAVPVLAALLFKAFIGDVYLVTSHSMEPLIRGRREGKGGGERVFVSYERPSSLQRWDLVVLSLPGEDDPAVKRIAGLPGESLRLQDGDLVVGGALLSPDAPRPEPIVLFDQGARPLPQEFQLSRGAWSSDPDGWVVLDGREGEVAASWTPRLTDGYLAPDGSRVEGHADVGDGAIEANVRFEEPRGSFRLNLTEQGDRFELEIAPRADGTWRAEIRRASPGGLSEHVGGTDFPFSPDAWLHVRFANFDNALRVELQSGESRAALRALYGSNRPLEGAPDPAYRHLAPRAALAARDVRVHVHGVRIARDLHFTSLGRFGVDQELVLGPDEVFVLGDNSSSSLDGRQWGPTPVRDVIGVPRWVVWPLTRARPLKGVGAPGKQ